jgi:hypothetical protein
MSSRTAGAALGLLAIVSAASFFPSCMAVGYDPQYGPSTADDSALAGDSWAYSSTARPYVMRDDPSGPSYGKAGLYSYAHNARGQQFALDPGEIRGVFQTRAGMVISLTLGIHLRPGGQFFNFIWVSDFSDRDNLRAWRYETTDRDTYYQTSTTGRPVTVTVSGGASGTKIQVLADGETMRATLDDLYRWRKIKVQDWRSHQVTIAGEQYAILATIVETDEVDSGAGNAFFKVSALLEERDRLDPDYAVLYVAGQGERVSDRIPIGNSGFECVWEPSRGIYVVRGFGRESLPTDGSAEANRAYEASRPGVVKIVWQNAGRGGLGTGFFVSTARGLVLTNNHVVVDDRDTENDPSDDIPVENVQVTFADGAQSGGRVVARHPSRDLALVRVERPSPNARELLFAPSDPSVGQEVVLIGHPAGFDWTLSTARIAASRSDAEGPWLQLDGPVNPGNSGGPVLDKQGNVLGVIEARFDESKSGRVLFNIGVAIPAGVAREFVNRSR